MGTGGLGIRPPAGDGTGQPRAGERGDADMTAGARAVRAEAGGPVARLPGDGRPPLSLQQEALWFLDRLAPGLPVYNVTFPSRIRGPLEITALRRAFSAMAARHESLRTRFGSHDGVPHQLIDPPRAVSLPVSDLSGLPEAERQPRAEALAADLAGRPFDLAAGPLFRPSLLRLSPDDHILLFNAHHIVTDGWSHRIVTKELAALYDAFTAGEPSPLPPLPIQYADYAVWQRLWLAGPQWERELAYWTERLAGLAPLDFPADRPRPANRSWAGGYLGHLMPATLHRDLQALAMSEGAPLLAVLLAGFLVVLARYTGQDDLAVGSVFGGRTRQELDPLVGFFVNTLVLRTSVAGNPTFRELLARARDTTFGALAHQDVPFGKLVDALRPQRDPASNPLFQVSFALEAGLAATGGLRLGRLDTESFALATSHSRFDLGATAKQEPDGRLGLWVEYSTELFTRERIARLGRHFQAVLEHAVRDPEVHLGELRMLAPTEREQVLRHWNPVPRAHPTAGKLLHQLVEQQAAAQPGHVSVQFGDTCLSYSELDTRANQIAWLLRELGIGPDKIAGVLLDRGADLPLAQLGILKAGGAWLPLDPVHPGSRLEYQLSDAAAVAVITTRGLRERLPAAAECLCLDDPGIRASLGRQPAGPPPGTTTPDNLAYVIYTSGSTGKPKGVLISHQAVVNFVTTCRDLFRITPADRVLQFANPTFDVSVFDIYSALCSGATVIAAPASTLHDPPALARLMRSAGVTMADIPPSMLALLDPKDVPSIRLLWVGMEPFPGDIAERWNTPEREFHHGYGPTEATVGCINYRCPREPLLGSPAIGRAMANHRAYVLDPHLNPVPVGICGELYVAGAGLARGYLNRPDLTAERFVPDPFADAPRERMYRTGDLARWREDGNLEFIGRTDTQIKINGLRIELGEIEHALAGHPGVRQVAVVPYTPPGASSAQLTAYVVAADPAGPPTEQQLRRHAADELPMHMVPGIFIFLDQLPLNASGKIDRASLPAPQAHSAEPRPPVTPTERAVAEIWRGILRLPADLTDVNGSFFALGGNSLQLIQLLSRIKERFGQSLDMREVFLSPTAGQLAAAIDERLSTVPGRPGGDRAQAGPPQRSLVPVKPGGSRRAFFCVHAVGGSVVPYVPLAQLLPADRPFYGLEALGLHGEPLIDEIPAMAQQYLAALRTVQPAGPYHLGGWSIGGVIAFEMARQLLAEGERLASLVLLDTAVPPGLDEIPGHAALLTDFAEDLAALQARQPAPLDQMELAALPEDEQANMVIRIAEEAGLIPCDVRAEMRVRIQLFVANATAALRYRPRYVDCRVTLVSAAETNPERTRGWSEFASGIDRYTLPGTHYSILQRPQAIALADLLERCLEQAEAPSP
jgi:amino acid adenylation domain-containing protein